MLGLGRPFWLIVVAAFATLSIAGTAMTNSATVPTTTTSTGAGTIGKFTVSTVKWNLDTTDPRNVSTITFKIVAPGTTPTLVRIKPVSTGTTWYTCNAPVVNGADRDVTCPTTSPTQLTVVSGLTNMTNLQIVIRD